MGILVIRKLQVQKITHDGIFELDEVTFVVAHEFTQKNYIQQTLYTPCGFKIFEILENFQTLVKNHKVHLLLRLLSS